MKRTWHEVYSVHGRTDLNSLISGSQKYLSEGSYVKLDKSGMYPTIRFWCTKKEWVVIRDFHISAYKTWLI